MIRNGQFVLHRCNFDRFFNRPQAAGIDRTRQRLFFAAEPKLPGYFWLSLASPNTAKGPKVYRGHRINLSDRIFDAFPQSRLLQKGGVLL